MAEAPNVCACGIVNPPGETVCQWCGLSLQGAKSSSVPQAPGARRTSSGKPWRSADDYARELDRRGLAGRLTISAYSIPEAEQGLRKAKDAKTQLRQVKQAIKQDMKLIRHTSGAPGSASAQQKQRYRHEQERLLQPYENLLLYIDSSVTELGSVEVKLHALIDHWKAEEDQKQLAELELLRTVHLATTPPNAPHAEEPRSYGVPRPEEPTLELQRLKPLPPELRSPGLRGKLSQKYRQRIEAHNQHAMARHEEAMASWQATRKRQEEEFAAAHLEYRAKLQEWEDDTLRFQQAEIRRLENLRRARIEDPSTMGQLLSNHLEAIEWPPQVVVESRIGDDTKTASLAVRLPSVQRWPAEQSSLKQRQEDYRTHTHSVVFRVVGEAFYTLPGIEQVLIFAQAETPGDTARPTEMETLLRAAVPRANWKRIDFDHLDTIDVVELLDQFKTKSAAAADSGEATGRSYRESIPRDVQIFVWRRDEGRCVNCGSQENLEFDHIIPLARGGANTARNLQILCEACNRAKGATVGA